MSSASTIRTIHYVTESEKGAAPLGPLRWEKTDTGFTFAAGGKGETAYHLVMYEKKFYRCVKTHTKTTYNYPGSTAGATLWELLESYDCVATSLLIAEYLLAENLGVGALEMYDTEGNTVCRIKDGEIECHTGTFDGATVKGNIQAQTIDLEADASVYINPMGVTLPELDSGYSRELTVIKMKPRSDFALVTTLIAENSNTKIVMGTSLYDTQALKSSLLLDYGLYKLYGVRYSDTTYWFVTQLNQITS
jgi:hypothetical protein